METEIDKGINEIYKNLTIEIEFYQNSVWFNYYLYTDNIAA